MPTTDPARVRRLDASERPPGKGDIVVYWMQQSQRAAQNEALEHAVQRANELRLPLLVVFALMPDYPDANARHFAFLLQGLRETAALLARRGIRLVARQGEPARVLGTLAKRAAWLVCDRGYLRHQRQWRTEVARAVACPVEEVEADAVVPVAVASTKAEFSARTFRPKVLAQLPRFLVERRPAKLRHPAPDFDLGPAERSLLDLTEPGALLARLHVDGTVPPASHLRPGTAAARRALADFVAGGLARYVEARREPHATAVSVLSAYLHFGQLSPVEVACRVQAADAPPGEKQAFLEQLIVRRELAFNFVEYTPGYDGYEAAVPAWARRTLHAHRSDHRDNVYSPQQLEQAATHDPYWNAMMTEMRATGYLHNALRMYWGKKILEWSATPQAAFAAALALNNRWFVDGRDPVSHANVAWVFGLHDRPWQERPIFGTVRWMSARGLERKMDVRAYVAQVRDLAEPPPL